MNYYAGLDIGGTNGRLKLCTATGDILGEFQAAGCSVNTDDYEKSRQRCRNLILPNLEALGLKPEDCKGICAAVSGVDSPSTAASCLDIFEEMGFNKDHLHIVNDCEVFLHLSEGSTMVLISGTGSICYGRDEADTIYRTGGWNHIVSDEGSGFDLGLGVLRAVANDLDHRVSAPVLTSMIVQESGLNTLEKLNDFINMNVFEKSNIAEFARTGYEAALQGDAEALRIHRKCAALLYTLVMDTFRKMDSSLKLKADIWLWGSVLVKNNLVREYLSEMIRANLPCLTIRIPEISALDTALKAAMKK